MNCFRNGITSQTPTADSNCPHDAKSTQEGLEQDFNTLDAQRESAEAYITSQRHEGWTCLEQHYDDGGFTGANTQRPALLRLMEDIEAGKIDCVIVYKVDRLSRSLLDFAQLIATFDKLDVLFVSVTQQFNTATSMGRLTLNILLSFAQFERETIAERTRDKMSAARRKGKWCGGRPILGYDVINVRLVVNEIEAQRVREIFTLYEQLKSLRLTLVELERRGWHAKQWTAKKGKILGGQPFSKPVLYQFLLNPVFVGKVRHKGVVYPGEHSAIVDEQVFAAVAKALHRRRGQRKRKRDNLRPPLAGLLRCSGCDRRLTHSYSQKGSRRYRYYKCPPLANGTASPCNSTSLPASEIEQFVFGELKRRLTGQREDVDQVSSEEQPDWLKKHIKSVSFSQASEKLTIEWHEKTTPTMIPDEENPS